MTIAVLPVLQGDDGRWRTLRSVVFSSRQLQTVESLEPFTPEVAEVDNGERVLRLTVYRYQDRKGWVVLADAEPAEAGL